LVCQYGVQDAAQFRGRSGPAFSRPPGDKAVRPDEKRTVSLDADSRLPPTLRRQNFERRAGVREIVRRGSPIRIAGEQQRLVGRQVQSRDRVFVELDMRQAGARPTRKFEERLEGADRRRSLRNQGACVVALRS
jgi:hypothetical protein